MKRLLSRWIMRAQEGGKVIQGVLLGVTAVSTLVTALKGTWLEPYTIFGVAAIVLGSLAFMLVYDTSGVLNQQNVERMDRSDNFAGPGMAMSSMIRARQMAAFFEALREDDDPEAAQKRVMEETHASLRDYRHGIDIRHVFEGDPESREHRMAAHSPVVTADGGETQEGDE